MKKILIPLSILFMIGQATAAENAQWDETIKKVTEAVVSIRVNAVRPFDTERSQVTQATGFVVDAKRGIILTNRHVVNPGPVTAEGLFANREEVELTPIYRDPVHDFGFFQYNPKELEFFKPSELKLVENGARIGDEIKVIGNDSGEHMSILSATLARLDRSAPAYRRGGYNDFNSFYYQSAADTSGGSSGSPVVNRRGEVIAINAGGNDRSASSFFLPLFKITRALTAIQKGQPVSRGTIQTTLDYQPYDEVRRLGLPKGLEKSFRANNQGDGLLTVANTVLQGVADGKLKPGDILVSVAAGGDQLNWLSRYEAFEIFLDEHVGEKLSLTVSRQGKSLTFSIDVLDLHQITPSAFLQVGGGVFNDFSYQLARQTNLPVSGVYIATPGYFFSNAGIGAGSVIQSINNQPVTNLTDFKNALASLKQEEYFTVRYVNIGAPKSEQVGSVKFDTKWHHSSLCQRNDETGLWPCQTLQWQSARFIPQATKVKYSRHKNLQVNQISRALVMVQANLAYQIDGQNYPNYSGTGLIVDHKQGLVVVDRNTVPVKMADVTITFAGVAEVPAEVVFVHPLHAFTLLKYDPKLVAGSNTRSATLNATPLSPGDKVMLVGYQTIDRLISEQLNVSSFDPLTLPMPSIPQFREMNTNAVTINNPPAVASGVLLDNKGEVRSWWTNFAFGRSTTQTIDRGLPVKHIEYMLEEWRKNKKIDIYSLGIELNPLTLANARKYDLSNEWVEKFQSSGQQSQVLIIDKRIAGSDAYSKLKDGDLLLAIDDKVIHNFADFDDATQKSALELTVWRDGQANTIDVKTQRLNQADTDSIYIWAGALLQRPHRALAAQHGIETEGVFISWYWFGSPANRYNLRPLNRMIEIEGEPVEDLEGFIALTEKYQKKNYLRIRLMDLIGRESIITLKPDEHYWPTQKVFWNGKRWINQLVN